MNYFNLMLVLIIFVGEIYFKIAIFKVEDKKLYNIP